MADVIENIKDEKFELDGASKKYAFIFIALGLVGIIGSAVMNMDDLSRFWGDFLINNLVFIGAALGGTFFIAIQYVANAGWATVLKRIPEAMSMFIPIGFALMLIGLIGFPDVYDAWIHPHGHHAHLIEKKTAWLNIPFFMSRMVIFLLLWTLFSYMFRKHSLSEDLAEKGTRVYHRKSWNMAAVFIVVFALSVSASSWDWIMSIEPTWFSTIFGVYIFAGYFVSALVFITLFAIYLQSKGYLSMVNDEHFHDLGKLTFGFSIFWAYIWFSQFLLIWYADLPEETAYYMIRFKGPYQVLFFANLVINFIFPFLMLVSKDAKRSKKVLAFVGVVLLFGRWLDMYLMVMPGIAGEEWSGINFFELLIPFGYFGGFALVVLTVLSKANIFPKNHPYLKESLHHHSEGI